MFCAKQCQMKCDRRGWALLLVRLVVGSIFVAHGAQKVFGLFGGPGLENFVAWATSLGLPVVLAYLAPFAEFIGGLMLLLGIVPELGALITIPVMIGAIVLVHKGHGYFMQNGGFEYPLNLIFLAIAIIIGGHGKCALWNPLGKCCNNDKK